MISVQWVTFPKLPYLDFRQTSLSSIAKVIEEHFPRYSKPGLIHLIQMHFWKSENKEHVQQYTYYTCSDDCWTLALFYKRDDKTCHQVTLFLYYIMQSIKRKNWESVSYDIPRELQRKYQDRCEPTKHTESNVGSMLGPSWQFWVQRLDLTKFWSLICHNYCQVVNIKKSQQELQQPQYMKLWDHQSAAQNKHGFKIQVSRTIKLRKKVKPNTDTVSLFRLFLFPFFCVAPTVWATYKTSHQVTGLCLWSLILLLPGP